MRNSLGIAVVSGNSTISIWRFERNMWMSKAEFRLPDTGVIPPYVESIALSSDDSMIAYAASDGVVFVAGTDSGVRLFKGRGRHVRFIGNTHMLGYVSPEPTGCGNALEQLDADNCGNTKILAHEDAPVDSIIFCDDGRRVAVIRSDGILRVRAIGSGRIIAEWQQAGQRFVSAGFSHDGRKLAVGTADGFVVVFNVE